MPSPVPTCVCGTCRRCKLRASQRRYLKTDKGKATHRRYRTSPKGKANDTRINRRRIFVGEQYHGYAPTVAAAEQIRGYIKERIREFKQRQS